MEAKSQGSVALTQTQQRQAAHAKNTRSRAKDERVVGRGQDVKRGGEQAGARVGQGSHDQSSVTGSACVERDLCALHWT